MRAIQSFVKWLDSISEWTGRIFVWTVVPLTIIVVFEVISRYVFGHPHIWCLSIFTWLYGVHFMLLAGYTLLHKRHIAIDILYAHWTPRVQAVVDVVTYLLFFFGFVGIILWAGVGVAKLSWTIRETTATTSPLPLYPYKAVLPIAMVLLMLQGLSEFLKRLVFLIKGVQL